MSSEGRACKAPYNIAGNGPQVLQPGHLHVQLVGILSAGSYGIKSSLACPVACSLRDQGPTQTCLMNAGRNCKCGQQKCPCAEPQSPTQDRPAPWHEVLAIGKMGLWSCSARCSSGRPDGRRASLSRQGSGTIAGRALHPEPDAGKRHGKLIHGVETMSQKWGQPGMGAWNEYMYLNSQTLITL